MVFVKTTLLTLQQLLGQLFFLIKPQLHFGASQVVITSQLVIYSKISSIGGDKSFARKLHTGDFQMFFPAQCFATTYRLATL